MSLDYQLKRTNDKIKDLKQEQDRLMHALLRNRREEQFELDRIRREYTVRNNAITNRQEAVDKELRDKDRELERIHRSMEDERERKLAEEEEEERKRRR